jgi:hypothetical protein
MSEIAPRGWRQALWLAACFAVTGALGGLVSRKYAPHAGVGLILFWVAAWGAVGVAGGLALRASRRH